MNEPAAPPPLTPPPPLLAPARRRAGRWWKWLLGGVAAVFLLVVIAVVVLALSANRILRNAARNAIERGTGMPTQIADLRVSLLRPGLEVRGFKLTNPPEFGGGTFLDLPELRVELDRRTFSGDQVRLRLVRVNLAELQIVVDEQGRKNTDALGERNKAKPPKPPKPPGRQKPFGGLDRLEMTLGTLRYTDLGNPNLSRSFNFGVTNKVIANIKTREELGSRLILALIESGVPFYELIFGGIENLPPSEGDSSARRSARKTEDEPARPE